MKKKMGIVLSVGLLLSLSSTKAAESLELTNSILFGSFEPDDVRVQTVVPAVVGVAAAGTLFGFASKIVDAPYVGEALKKAALGLVKPQDLIEGGAIVIGANGIMGLWKKGPQHRADYIQSFGLMLAKNQVMNPGVVGEHEVRDAAIGALGVMHGVDFLKNNLPQLLGKLPTREDTV